VDAEGVPAEPVGAKVRRERRVAVLPRGVELDRDVPGRTALIELVKDAVELQVRGAAEGMGPGSPGESKAVAGALYRFDRGDDREPD